MEPVYISIVFHFVILFCIEWPSMSERPHFGLHTKLLFSISSKVGLIPCISGMIEHVG